MLNSSHMAANIREALEDMMESWLEYENTTFINGCVIMDNGANMLKAVCYAVFVGIRCIAYIMGHCSRVDMDALGLGNRA